MPYTAITEAEIASGKPVIGALWRKVRENFNWLSAQVGTASTASTVLNGSFEIDEDGDGIPDNWAVGTYPGGTVGRTTSWRTHGNYAMAFTHPGGAGNGGGYAVTDYIQTRALQGTALVFDYFAGAAGMKFMVNVSWYDVNQTLITSQTLWTNTVNPTSWYHVYLDRILTYSAATYYARFTFVGGYTDTDVAGTILLDDVRLVTQFASQNLMGGAYFAEGTHYAPITGYTPSAAGDLWTVVARAGTLKNLYVSAAYANNTLVVRKNGADTTLSASGTAGTDFVHTVDVVAGDKLGVRVVTSAAADGHMGWGLDFVSHVT